MRAGFAFMLTLFMLAVPLSAKAGVVVSTPETFETAPGMTVGGALMELQSNADDRLIAASSPVCEKVEIHTMSDEGGIMKMRQIDAIDLPAGQIVKLEATGNHLMLIGLKTPLMVGDEVQMTLSFEKAPDVTVAIPVRSRNEKKHGDEGTDAGISEDPHAGHH